MNNTHDNPQTDRIDLVSIRARLADQKGKIFWRSLDELSENPDFQEAIKPEFADNTEVWLDPFGRRKFLKIMAASFAFAGLTACKLPTETLIPNEKIKPYVRPPEEIVPGKPLYFATTIPFAGTATGVLVESHMGRPTKIEGNADHPASLGGSDVYGQASILNLYDPDRAQTITYLRESKSWGAFLGAISEALEARRSKGGEGFRFLTGAVSSPTLAKQIKDILALYPKAKWHQYEPAVGDGTRAGAKMAFGEDINTVYNISKANVIVSLGADFLTHGSASLRYARDFANRRRATTEKPLRLYTAESSISSTGASSDHRLPLKPSDLVGFAKALASALGVSGVTAGAENPAYKNWVAALSKELQENKGSSLVVAGNEQPAIVHALAHAINQALGNVGNTLTYIDAVESSPEGFNGYASSLKALVDDMNAGAVDMLVVVSGNPVYDAPSDLKFSEAMQKVALRVHYSLYYDETSEVCHWHIPETHYLESWSDARTYDGTASIVQPLIAPLYYGKTVHELFSGFSDQKDRTSYETVRAFWQAEKNSPDFENVWRKSLHDGVIAGTAFAAKTPTLKTDAFAASGEVKAGEMEIVFPPDPTVFDGRFANNGWLQELPKPLTKITWDNAVMMSPATAQRLGVSRDFNYSGGERGGNTVDMVEISYQGQSLKAAAWIVPGHANNTLTLHLGYGRKKAGRVGTNLGFNAYSIRTSAEMWGGTVTISKIGETYQMACTQGQQVMQGRDHDILRVSTFENYKSGKGDEHGKGHGEKQESHGEKKEEHGDKPHQLSHPENLSMYPEYDYTKGYSWGMAIDLASCVGCNACAAACQSENNVPVIGKEQVMMGRHMHWIRIDRYYTDNGHDDQLDNPDAYFQPLPCMQCEKAPCEVVCPVNATTHSSEGLNDMVYNRCVGTRYCANNCPYKVRRFNYLQYTDYSTPQFKLLNNPDVTVRSRGVMEKCTYCVQRINYARIEAEKENRPIKDGEVVTACQSVCPTQAIVFGNINDPESKVAKLKAEQRNYSMIDELATKPRTTYLSALRNPNPELSKKG